MRFNQTLGPFPHLSRCDEEKSQNVDVIARDGTSGTITYRLSSTQLCHPLSSRQLYIILWRRSRQLFGPELE